MHWDPAIGLPLLILSATVLAAIYFLGRRRPPAATRSEFERADSPRIEPSFDVSGFPASANVQNDGDRATDKVAAAGTATSEPRTAPPAPAHAHTSRALPGQRHDQQPIERIVSLFVAAREGQQFRGVDLVVAAEKVGLEFGDMNIFHRLEDRSAAMGPVFSVANMLKPGSFDLTQIDILVTPGLGFFMTLPGPLSALDAWDAMLPAAQRMAELLEGVLLDSERNALSRQGIQHIRDDLRSWDRRHEGEEIDLRTR